VRMIGTEVGEVDVVGFAEVVDTELAVAVAVIVVFAVDNEAERTVADEQVVDNAVVGVVEGVEVDEIAEIVGAAKAVDSAAAVAEAEVAAVHIDCGSAPDVEPESAADALEPNLIFDWTTAGRPLVAPHVEH